MEETTAIPTMMMMILLFQKMQPRKRCETEHGSEMDRLKRPRPYHGRYWALSKTFLGVTV